MDANFLSRLVHPLYKTPLRYDAVTDQLVSDNGKDRFVLKQQVPVLLVAQVQDALTHTQLHNDAGSRFQYKEHYQHDAETYDYFKETENAIEKEEHHKVHEYILAQIPAGTGWVLDTGCGGGWLAKALEGQGKNVISMDIADINPVKAVKNVPYPTHYGLVADVFELPLAAESIDYIVASEIIEHVPDPARFVAALFAVLKPGGKIIITTPYNERIQQSLCIHCNHLTPHNAHLHSFTRQSIARLVPAPATRHTTCIFNNKILIRLGLQRMLGFLPLPLWKGIDNLANTLTKNRAYRLMLVIEK